MTLMRRGRTLRVTHDLIAAHRTRVQALRVSAYRQAWRRLRDIVVSAMRYCTAKQKL